MELCLSSPPRVSVWKAEWTNNKGGGIHVAMRMESAGGNDE